MINLLIQQIFTEPILGSLLFWVLELLQWTKHKHTALAMKVGKQ